MTTGKVGFVGQTPKTVVQRVRPNPEKVKYVKAWQREEYRKFAPGEALASSFLAIAKPAQQSEVIDFGAGTGRGALMLAFMGRLIVHMVDFVPEALDPEVAQACVTQPTRISFLEHDLTIPLPFSKNYGFCTDVMEHIPEDLVDIVLQNILTAAQRVFFSISTRPDSWGQKLIGDDLHVTVKPYEWWLEKFKAKNVVVYYTEKLDDDNAIFYVSSWQQARELYSRMTVNTDEQVVLQHIKANIVSGFDQVKPHQKQDTELMILAGGPSLSDFEEEIRAKRQGGMPLVCTNGTYNWCLERNIVPSAVIVLDARPFNARFISKVLPNVKYLIASQCHPSVLENLPKEQTLLFHCTLCDAAEEILDAQYGAWWFAIPGGSTVTLRAFTLMRLLGWWRFHVYGFDSCFVGEKHHAYPQVENDGDIRQIGDVAVPNNTQTFRCAPWMVAQAQEFVDQVRAFGDEVTMCVYGTGLIANIIQSAAAGD